MARRSSAVSTLPQSEVSAPGESGEPASQSQTTGGTKSLLSSLYELLDIETVHVISMAIGVDISADVGDDIPRTLHLPEGSYLVLRVTSSPIPRPGLFFKQAPKSTD